MRKRIYGIILAVSLVLTGCGAGTNTASGDVTLSTSTSESTEAVDETEGNDAAELVVDEEQRAIWMDPERPVEERVAALLSQMTLEEKAYQMQQSEQANISTDEITSTGIGSVLSGGGSAPSTGNTVTAWNEYVNSLKEAALNSRLGIPLIYGIDAVHGNNNVYGATVFPHNIALGAANDEELMEEIARVTADEIKATAIQWDFSPCLGNAQNVTWGRTYECFSENTDDITRLAVKYIETLQENGIVACAKHYIGEGYTVDGVNQGNVDMTAEEFDELLADGVLDPYTGAVNAGVLTVMPSYNSVDGVKCHANYHLLTEVLKEQLGFKGFVISDYNAIEQISVGSLKDQVCTAINAGVDMLMQVSTWDTCAKYIVQLVNEGRISEERIDDAVSRILYVKFTAGLFEEEIGSDEEKAAIDRFGSDEHREVARRAVRESLVLLKNDMVGDETAIDALKSATYITMEGSAAYDMGRQCGGWTISWQGQSGKITAGTTIIEGVYAAVKDTATLKHSVDGSFDTELTDAVIAVFGEVPYAETDGDRDDIVKMAANDVKMLNALKENIAGIDDDVPVIGIIIAGRPIDISDYEDMFDAIIMAWLPGTEGEGIADVLFGDYDFTGKLSFTWDMGGTRYEYGYGLTK